MRSCRRSRTSRDDRWRELQVDAIKASRVPANLARSVLVNAQFVWDKREHVRADMCRSVSRVLRRHTYPPERTHDATDMVVRQAELLTTEAT